MAQIPLAQIPNAPDLASMSRPMVNDVSVPKVDFGGERAAVARGYESAMQNPRNAELIGGAVAEAGQGVYKAAKSLVDKQQELNDNAAWAEFSTNYTLQKADLDDSLLKSNPSTWASSYANFRAKNVDPMWAALPVSVQQRHYADYLKLTSEDQARVGHAAFQKNIADSTAKSLTDINLQIENNQFDAALEKLEALHSINGIGGMEYEAQKSKIQTAQQYNKINEEIVRDPLGAQRKFLAAFESDSTLPEYPNISKDQIKGLATRAEKVFEVQQNNIYGELSSDISAGKLKSSVDLEKDPRFSNIKDEKFKQSLKESIADRYIYTPAGDAFTKDAMARVKVFPQTDNPATEAMDVRKYINENVPSIYRDAIGKALESKINEMASNNGRLKPENELIQYGNQRLAVARDGGVFGKFYSDNEVKEDSSGKKAKANIEVLKQIEDVEVTLRNSGAKTRSEADKVIEEATAAGRAKQAAGEIGNQKGWFDFLNSRKSEADKRPGWLNGAQSSSAGEPAGKITKYGYEKPGQADYDSNSARGIGAADNKLVPGESVALSPDLERATGAKIGDKVVVTLENGQKMVKRFDDRTSKRLKGRVDIYSPDGNQPLDGVRVAKVERYTEDGRG